MKQAQFISTMSEGLGVEQSAVKAVIRVLRESGLGLVTTGARGVNAPDNTPMDAVRVTIALVASNMPSRAARDVVYFGKLKPDLRPGAPSFTAELGIDPDKTLEETLLDFAEGRINDPERSLPHLTLSDLGDASLDHQAYHQREKWEAVMRAPCDPDLLVSGGNHELHAAMDDWESMSRAAETKINRISSFPTEYLRRIVSQMLSSGGE